MKPTQSRQFSPIFTAEEELKLVQIMNDKPNANWKVVADLLDNKHSPRQCRDHWLNKLCLVQKTSERLGKEDLDNLFDLVDKYGLKFDLIAKWFRKRSPNELKLSYFRNVKNRNKLDFNSIHDKYRVNDDNIQLQSMVENKPMEKPEQKYENRMIFPLINPDDFTDNHKFESKYYIGSMGTNYEQTFEDNRGHRVIKPNMMSLVTMLNSGSDNVISVI